MSRRPVACRVTQIKTFTLRHKDVCRRYVAGQRNMDIARDTGYCREYVCAIKNSKVGRAYVEKLQAEREQDVKEVQRRLTEMELQAVKVLELTLEAALSDKDSRERQEMCPSPAQIRAAEKHLERQGYAKPPVSTILHASIGGTQAIADLKRRHAEIEAKERKAIEQPLPNAEIIEDGEIVEVPTSGQDTTEGNE